MDCGNRGGAGIGCAFRSGLYKREGAFPNYSCAIAGNREHAEHRAASVSRLHVSLRDRIAAVVGCHHRGGGDGKKENLSWHVPYKLLSFRAKRGICSFASKPQTRTPARSELSR